MEDSMQLSELRMDKRLFDQLPRDIVDTLFHKLSIKDQFRFARVCKLAHSLVYERVNPIALKDTPWLIRLSNNSSSLFETTRLTNNSSSLFETTYDNQVTCYQIGTRPFKYSKPNILGYSKGWFYVDYSRNNLIQLVNLFIDVQIDLPPLSTMAIPKFKGFVYAQAFALSLCKSMRPLMIAIIDEYGDLALCKTNGGGTWKTHHDHHYRDELYYHVTFHREKLYVMRERTLQTVDIFEVGDDDLRLFPLGVIEYKNVINHSIFNVVLRQAHLVEDSKGDNMFIVMEYQDMDGVICVSEVFKVVRDGDELVRMEDLGDQIILLNDSNSEIIDVKNCSPSDIFKGNQICFQSWYHHAVGIYSLNNRIAPLWTDPDEPLQCRLWIFPRFITTTECDCESH